MSSKRVFRHKRNKFERNPVTTPIATGIRVYKPTSDDDNLMDDPKEYQSIDGSQMYAMLCIRPDLAYAIKSHYAVTNMC